MPLRLRVIPPAGLKAGDRRSPTTERLVEFGDDVDEIRIGRRADVELSLPFVALSGLHARLRRKRAGNGGRGDAWMIEDLDSKNGTFVNGVRLHQGEQRLMLAGIEVDLAHVRLVFDGRFGGGGERRGDGDDRPPPRQRSVPRIARRRRPDTDGGRGGGERQRHQAGRTRSSISRRTIQDLRPASQGRRALPRTRVVHARFERHRGARSRVEERRPGQWRPHHGAAPRRRRPDPDGPAQAASDRSPGPLPARPGSQPGSCAGSRAPSRA